MTKPLGLALLVIGVVLLVMGIGANDSIASKLSNFFTGSPTDKTVWLIGAGIVCAIVGGGSLLMGGRKA
ncbi:MAG: DUF3185 family protein [Planctomycetes bacterium]|nr:DUF3185 family protein [Planctomycetota bacterium]